jgi:hypothetical protein
MAKRKFVEVVLAPAKPNRKIWNCKKKHVFAFTPGQEPPVCPVCGGPLFLVKDEDKVRVVKEMLFPPPWKKSHDWEHFEEVVEDVPADFPKAA